MTDVDRNSGDCCYLHSALRLSLHSVPFEYTCRRDYVSRRRFRRVEHTKCGEWDTRVYWIHGYAGMTIGVWGVSSGRGGGSGGSECRRRG